ncbi:MAG: restriction endonuclease subunit S [Thermomonas sp.]|uniref:restriction endonuclease subunit S n=1 Tax=Thermomonas sp. TaxID=1971895 RepID=UPI0039E3365F
MKPGYKQTEVGVIPEDWEVHSLGDLNPFVTSGSRGWAEFYADHGDLFVRITNMSRESIYLDLADSKFVRIPPDSSEGVRTQLRESDVLISITADIGITSYVDATVPLPAYINQHIALVRLNPARANGKFVSYFLAADAAQRNFRATTDNGAKAGMSLGGVAKIQAALPPLSEQSAIATALSDVDALLSGLDKLIAKKRDLKQAAMQQLLTGKTRLPGFAGQWEVKRLGDVGECLRGVSYNGDADLFLHDTEITKRLLRSNNVQDAVVVTSDVQFVNADRVADHQILKEGDVLICMANGSRALVGKAGYFSVADGFDYTFGAFMGVFRSVKGLAKKRFVFYLFQTGKYRQYIANLLAGSSINNLTPSSIESLEFELPPIEEQAAIAEVLSDTDAELAALEQRREKTRLLKQGMMHELLTGRTRLVQPASNVVPFKKSEVKPVERKANVHFRRSVFAAEIVERLHAEPTFGHVKFQKLIYLAEHMCKVNIDAHYHRDAAGPYDNRALRSIDSQMEKSKWFKAQKVDKRYQYVPLEKRGDHKQYFDRYFADSISAFDKVIDAFKSAKSEQCEIVATLYEAWRDLLAKNADTSDDSIVDQVLNHWHDNKRKIEEERWRKALEWMRAMGFVPQGCQ